MKLDWAPISVTYAMTCICEHEIGKVLVLFQVKPKTVVLTVKREETGLIQVNDFSGHINAEWSDWPPSVTEVLVKSWGWLNPVLKQNFPEAFPHFQKLKLVFVSGLYEERFFRIEVSRGNPETIETNLPTAVEALLTESDGWVVNLSPDGGHPYSVTVSGSFLGEFPKQEVWGILFRAKETILKNVEGPDKKWVIWIEELLRNLIDPFVWINIRPD